MSLPCTPSLREACGYGLQMIAYNLIRLGDLLKPAMATA
jgi:hypothetical protein